MLKNQTSQLKGEVGICVLCSRDKISGAKRGFRVRGSRRYSWTYDSGLRVWVTGKSKGS